MISALENKMHKNKGKQQLPEQQEIPILNQPIREMPKEGESEEEVVYDEPKVKWADQIEDEPVKKSG